MPGNFAIHRTFKPDSIKAVTQIWGPTKKKTNH